MMDKPYHSALTKVEEDITHQPVSDKHREKLTQIQFKLCGSLA